VELLLVRPEREMAAADAELQLLSSGEPAAASQQGAAPPAESGAAAPGTDFASCYAKEMPGLVWFVMSLGAGPEAAADAAQSAFADAFPVWHTIRYPHAWLRRVAERSYYRRASHRETSVETPPDRPGPLSAASVVELRDEARTVLAALATLPPKQRQVMAWSIDGYSPAEIASKLGADPTAVRQNLTKARKNLKQLLGIIGSAR
jgi:RNA polymerase sigma factor (sigma-70 family)